ncbi:MAG TPA: FtsX-like permease family protein [Planctomycetota bacterium]|nr:FtsX-like permease family protein [Planctomycetota bacterium]
MYPLFLAIRYARSRAVTYLALVTVSMSVGSFVLVMAVLGGFRHKAEEIITKKASPLEVFSRSVSGVPDAAGLAADIETLPEVKAASPYKEVQVLLRTRNYRTMAGVRGVDLKKEIEFGAVAEYLLAGLPDPGEEAGPGSAADRDARESGRALRDLWAALTPWGDPDDKRPQAGPARQAQVTSFVVPPHLETKEIAREDLDPWEDAPAPGEAVEPPPSAPGTVPIWDEGRPAGGARPVPRDPDAGVPLPPPPPPPKPRRKPAPKAEPIPRGAIVGVERARSLDLNLGDEIILTTQGENKELRSRSFVVVGFYQTRTLWLDEGISIDRRAAEDLAGTPSATGISIWLHDVHAADAVLPRVQRVLEDAPEFRPEVQVRTWRKIQEENINTLEMQDRVMMIILLVLLVLNGAFIMAILWVLVSDKIRDIGTIRAIGAGRLGVVVTFLLQGLLIGVLGVILGVAGGLTLSENVNEVTAALDHALGWLGAPPLFGSISLSLFGMRGLPVYYDPVHMVAVVGVTLLISFLASLFPAWRAARLDPVEALRHD